MTFFYFLQATMTEQQTQKNTVDVYTGWLTVKTISFCWKLKKEKHKDVRILFFCLLLLVCLFVWPHLAVSLNRESKTRSTKRRLLLWEPRANCYLLFRHSFLNTIMLFLYGDFSKLCRYLYISVPVVDVKKYLFEK